MLHSIIDILQQLHIINGKNNWIITTNKNNPEPKKEWFTQEYWMNQGRLLGANSGRGSAWVIKSEWGKWVLRHFYRGGLYAKISKDSYFWSGLENTRAYQEFVLLNKIQEFGLPSPKPIAALITKQGIFYKNDLIMSHLAHKQTFADSIANNSHKKEIWQCIGKTIAMYHQHGIYHSDLNAHNILLNDGSNEPPIYIIDFDKGAIKKENKSWRQENLNRLKRSIEKVSGENHKNEFKAAWENLYEAYLEQFN